MTNFMGKKAGFVDSEFVKTCDELVIGSYSMLPRRSCKKKQKYLKRWKKSTNMIGDDKPSNVQVIVGSFLYYVS